MKKRIIPALTVLTMFLNCIPTNNKAVPDKTAKEIFNPSELEGIEKMIMFVDEIVLNNTNETDINQAYHTYFQNLETYITHDKFHKNPSTCKNNFSGFLFGKLSGRQKRDFENNYVWKCKPLGDSFPNGLKMNR